MTGLCLALLILGAGMVRPPEAEVGGLRLLPARRGTVVVVATVRWHGAGEQAVFVRMLWLRERGAGRQEITRSEQALMLLPGEEHRVKWRFHGPALERLAGGAPLVLRVEGCPMEDGRARECPAEWSRELIVGKELPAREERRSP